MIVEKTAMNILQLKNDVGIAEIKQNFFAASLLKSFILKNSLKVIIRLVHLLSSVPYKGWSVTPKLCILSNRMLFRQINFY